MDEAAAPGTRSAMELKHLRCLVAIIDAGSFTDAGIDLGISQAAVSRSVSALEHILGVRLLERTGRTVTPTAVGVQVIARARILLAGADELVLQATTGHTRLLLGHAWSAFGRYTAEFQRRWHQAHPEVELHLVRHNTPTGGLAERLCDLAVVRAPLDLRPYAHALIGSEPRYVAMSSDDPWARRRSIRLQEIAARTVVIDHRTGTTTWDLWPEGGRPEVEYTHDIDDWLAAIASGRRVGITPQATAAQYRREGITYRVLHGAHPVPVHLIWRAADTHPATHAAIALAKSLYREGEHQARSGQAARRSPTRQDVR